MVKVKTESSNVACMVSVWSKVTAACHMINRQHSGSGSLSGISQMGCTTEYKQSSHWSSDAEPWIRVCVYSLSQLMHSYKSIINAAGRQLIFEFFRAWKAVDHRQYILWSPWIVLPVLVHYSRTLRDCWTAWRQSRWWCRCCVYADVRVSVVVVCVCVMMFQEWLTCRCHSDNTTTLITTHSWCCSHLPPTHSTLTADRSVIHSIRLCSWL